MKLKQALNGKKLSISTLVLFAVGYGALQAQVKNHDKELDIVRPNTEQIARVDEKVKALHGEFTEFKSDYNEDQRIVQQDIKNILSGIRKLSSD